ncbi:hypothetical protein BDZ97DRAFT_1630582, partial [Flammula alnicola]
PSVLPLLVKSPYFNSWLPKDASNANSNPDYGQLAPVAWNGRTLGLIGIARVDNQTWQWQGSEGPSITISKVLTRDTFITPTRTILTLEAGPVLLNVTYLSPIDPVHLYFFLVREPPCTYLSVDVWSNDGHPHSVQLYCDLTGEWVSSANSSFVAWNTTQTNNSLYSEMFRTVSVQMAEIDDLAEDGTIYLATTTTTGDELGTETIDRYALSANTFFLNLSANTFISFWPVNAISQDLGTVTETSSSAVWSIGFVRDPVIQFDLSGTPKGRSYCYNSVFQTPNDTVDAVVEGFQKALDTSITLDYKIMSEAGAISQDHADLVALSLRQTIGATDLTISKGSDGLWNTSDIQMFMKDIGNGGRVNPVDTMYASFPAFLYINASLAGFLLRPLLEAQTSSQYTNLYAAPDLGSSYPNAQVNKSDTEILAVENCGNMLIMVLAHAQKSGDGSLISEFEPLLRTWADYLVTHSLHPDGYVTTDGLNFTDMSNLALKGIIGIFAMSKINSALEPRGAKKHDTDYYQSIAVSYAQQWGNLSFMSNSSSPYISTTYGGSSWGLMYNLYASTLLNSNL